MNTTALFRPVLEIMRDSVRLAGGPNAVQQFRERTHEKVRVYLCLLDANGMLAYDEALPDRRPFFMLRSIQ